jgi:hypothetical protein
MKNSTVKERSATKKQVRMSSHISFPTPRVHPLEQRCRGKYCDFPIQVLSKIHVSRLTSLSESPDDLETWRAEAYSQAQHGIDETCSELLSTLSSTIESEQVLIVDAAVRKAEVFKSLDREQVRLVRTTAKGYEEASVTTLGESMRAFQSLAETERASQEALWEEWDLVQAEVVALGLEILGPEDFGSFD